jgi:colanic acid/amylovoran biosynthesis protein WcaK/AmsJ
VRSTPSGWPRCWTGWPNGSTPPWALAPHLGSLEEGVVWGEQELNLEIVAASGSERLAVLSMLTARENLALIETAILSVSTRYHPTVFGPAHGTPTGAISLSYYSSVRMRGAMRHAGMDGFVVPSPCLDLAPQAFEELVERGDEVRDHLGRAAAAGHDLQQAWWDSIVDGVRTGTWRHPGELPVVESLQPRGAWRRSVRQTADALERRSRKRPAAAWA